MKPIQTKAFLCVSASLRQILLSLLVLPLLAQAPQTQPEIRTGADEVILDVVVRDKKGKLLRELGPADFEAYDNGAKIPIRSVRLVEGKEATTKAGATPLDPMRQIRLVTLV